MGAGASANGSTEFMKAPTDEEIKLMDTKKLVDYAKINNMPDFVIKKIIAENIDGKQALAMDEGDIRGIVENETNRNALLSALTSLQNRMYWKSLENFNKAKQLSQSANGKLGRIRGGSQDDADFPEYLKNNNSDSKGDNNMKTVTHK